MYKLNHPPTIFMPITWLKMPLITLFLREGVDFDGGVIVIAGIAVVIILLIIIVLIGARTEKELRDLKKKNGR